MYKEEQLNLVPDYEIRHAKRDLRADRRSNEL